MTSAFALSPQRVREVVPSDAVGFYELGIVEDDDFWPVYFGRSDCGLQSRLVDHGAGRTEVTQQVEVTHFRPVVTRTIRRAYELECREWHLRGEKMENDIHPARPAHIGYECPYCDLEHRLATA